MFFTTFICVCLKCVIITENLKEKAVCICAVIPPLAVFILK